MLTVDFTCAKLLLQLEDSNHRQAFKRLPERAGDFRHQALADGNGLFGLLIGSFIVLASRMQGRRVAGGRDTCCIKAAAAAEHCLALAFGGGFGYIP